MDNTKAALAAGIAGGYVLGRTKKAKLAFAVATYLAGRRFALKPRDLAKAGLHSVRQHPQLSQVSEQLREEVVQAGRSAVTAAASHRVEAMANALRTRTEAIRGPEDGEQDEDEDEVGGEEEQEEPEETPAEKPAAGKAKAKAKSGRSPSRSGKAR
jgi:hypothetical protein